MHIAIIDYGSGNLRSAQKAFAQCGQGDVILTHDPETVRRADYIVLPGVGAFHDCAAGLRAIDGMEDALNEAVIKSGTPFLGICVGMQLMCMRSLEFGTYAGLGWIDAEIRKMTPQNGLKIPHMGWNDLHICTPHPVLEGLDGGDVYFVHSYAAFGSNKLATFDYGAPYIAALGRDNMLGTQFHPEKSQKLGLHLIDNFLKWRP